MDSEPSIPVIESKKNYKGAIVAVLAFIIAFIGFRYLTQTGIEALSGDSKQESIVEVVNQINKSTVFPKQLDAVTTWTGIFAESNAIRYEYTLSAILKDEVTEEELRNSLVPILCANADSRKLLDQDVNMNYTYRIEDTTQMLKFSVSKIDCK